MSSSLSPLAGRGCRVRGEPPALQSPRLHKSQFTIKRLGARVGVDDFQDVALCRKRLDRALHELPRDAAPPVRDHRTGAAVVGLLTVETIENESDQTVTIERAGREVGPVAAADDEVREVLGGVFGRDVVIAEGIVERSSHRLEIDAGQ